MKFNSNLLFWEPIKIVAVDQNANKSGIANKNTTLRVIVSTDRYVALSGDSTLAVTNANGCLLKAGVENFIHVGEHDGTFYICFSAAIVLANDSVWEVK